MHFLDTGTLVNESCVAVDHVSCGHRILITHKSVYGVYECFLYIQQQQLCGTEKILTSPMLHILIMPELVFDTRPNYKVQQIRFNYVIYKELI